MGLRAPARCRARPDRGLDPGLLRELAASGQVVLADKGYAGAGDHVRIPYRDGASPPRTRTPTARTPSYAARANAPTLNSRPGASCANSAAAPGRPGSWRKLSTYFDTVHSILQATVEEDLPGLERAVQALNQSLANED